MEESKPKIKDICTFKKSAMNIFEEVKVKIEPENGLDSSKHDDQQSDKLNNLQAREVISGYHGNKEITVDQPKTDREKVTRHDKDEKNKDIVRVCVKREKVTRHDKDEKNKDIVRVCVKRKLDSQQNEKQSIEEHKVLLLDQNETVLDQSKNIMLSTVTRNTKISDIKIIEKSKHNVTGNDNVGYRSIINMANIKAGNVSILKSDTDSGTVKYTSLLKNKTLGLNTRQNEILGINKSSNDSESSSGIVSVKKITVDTGKSFNNFVSSQGIDGSKSSLSPGVTAMNKSVIDAGKLSDNSVLVQSIAGSNSRSSSGINANNKIVIDTGKSHNSSELTQNSERLGKKVTYRSILNPGNSKPTNSVSSRGMDESISGLSSGTTTMNKIIIDASKSNNQSELAQSADGSNKTVAYRSILNQVNSKPSPVSNSNCGRDLGMQSETFGASFVDSKSEGADLKFYSPTNFNVLVNRVGGEIRIKMVDCVPLDQSKSSSCTRENDVREDSEIEEYSDDYKVGDAEEHGEMHACNFCAKLFPTTEKLKEHTVQHSVKDFYRCYVCNEGFLFEDDLKEHFVTHTVEKPYKCDVCEKQFTSNSGLNMHKLIHTGDKPHPCPICGKEFTRATVLRRHQRVHTGEKLFRCEECGKHYANSFSLGQHKLIHTGERPHKCEECGKEFRLSNGLRRHMLLHTGEKPHCCYYCGRNFRQSTQLKNHKCLSLKNIDKFFECPDCGEKFKESDDLHVHMATHSG